MTKTKVLPDPYYVQFYNNNDDIVGELFLQNGVIKFSGNIGHSAQLLFQTLQPFIDDYIQENSQ